MIFLLKFVIIRIFYNLYNYHLIHFSLCLSVLEEFCIAFAVQMEYNIGKEGYP